MQPAKRSLVLTTVLACVLMAWAVPKAAAAVPIVSTEHASHVTDATATLNGTVSTDQALSACQFEYVTAAAYRVSGFGDLSSGGSAPCVPAAVSIPADSAPHAVSADIVRAIPGEPLSFRLRATNASASVTGLISTVGSFGLASFDATVLKQNGDPATQAGSHPYTASAPFFLRTGVTTSGFADFPIGALQDSAVELPPGLVGNPRAYPTCTEVQLQAGKCPVDSQLGVVTIYPNIGQPPGFRFPFTVGVYNMEVPFGLPAMFAFNIVENITHVYAELRTGEDYGLTMVAKNTPQTLPIEGVAFKFWGVPSDPSHNNQRGPCVGSWGPNKPCPVSPTMPPTPFVSLPTACVGPVETTLEVTSWEGKSDSASVLSHDNTLPTPNPIGADGCNAVDFSPSLEARPTTTVADAPSGLDVDLHIPQNEDPEGTAAAHLRDTTVTLPDGLVVNPASANGLEGCSLAEFGFTEKLGDVIHTTPDPATCPEASKLGTASIETPLLESPMPGAVYLADPHQNPFNSLLALYIAVDDEKTGLVVKLAGEVKADPQTGQLTTTFKESPQQPFEDFRLHFFGGAGGALRTPATCGQFTTASSLTPWTAPESGPPASPTDTWAITQAPGGGACPGSLGAIPNSPDLDAGSASPIAAVHSPMVVSLRRQDGSQQFSSLSLTLPPGLTGKLAGVTACPEAALAAAAQDSGNQEKAQPSCPASSRIGSVDAAAGAGPAPYHAQGTAYLTGPYKGAPIGMAIITPATAGPFDLGNVVVRAALQIDPRTAQITAVSDQIPSILQGIPLDLRSVQISVDRPSFTLNGTSCDPSSFTGQLVSTLSQTVPLTERYQLGECGRLAFKPKLAIRLIGGTRRGAHPALRGTLQMPPGGANLERVSVALPRSEFLDQAHIGTVCTRVQFAAEACPAASVYGAATATSPLVEYPLSGPVYLRSSDNELPDLVMALRGPAHQPVEVDAVARIDSVKGGIRSTFEGVPDLPVSTVVLSMAGGRKGLLQNSTNICKGKHRATAEFDAQNGKVADLRPLLRNGKCGPQKKRGAKKQKRRGAR
ncbi:MAG TPA: hypothetical protein VN752_01280 [Solirubrobacterales bacterium]|nr:hypothetical protein [Solirubrobacterales bacterium]